MRFESIMKDWRVWLDVIAWVKTIKRVNTITYMYFSVTELQEQKDESCFLGVMICSVIVIVQMCTQCIACTVHYNVFWSTFKISCTDCTWLTSPPDTKCPQPQIPVSDGLSPFLLKTRLGSSLSERESAKVHWVQLAQCTLHNAHPQTLEWKYKIYWNLSHFPNLPGRHKHSNVCKSLAGTLSLSHTFEFFFDKTPMKSLFKLCNFKLIKTSLVVNIGDNHWQIRILKHKKEDLFHHHDRTLWQTEKAKGWKFFSNMRGWHGKACVKWRGEKYLVKFGDK